MTPFEARWCTDRVLDGTLEVDGDEIRVTDAGWDLILSVGAAGTELDVDDDAGRGLCSALNGVGTTQTEAPALSALPPGVYYLAVRESSFVDITDPAATFNYRLVVFTRSPY